MPDIDGQIVIEAWINMPNTDGIQFITMFGDYGWGLYLNDGYLAYSNEYSMSRNPTSNVSVQENIWTHVKVIVSTAYAGEFFIDNQSAGLIDINKSQIPAGDFGSNDCFQSGEECDELYIGRMGAGCDCNYFQGMLDDVRIGNNAGNDSLWTFSEGEGEITNDSQGRTGEIHGASWVMPDGTIIAQAVELENDEYLSNIEASAGDTLLFFIEIPENTQYLSLTMYSFDFDFEDEDYYENVEFEIYVSMNDIPSEWDHDYEVETYDSFGLYVYELMEWPEEGTYWITVSSNYDIENMEIGAFWEEAPEPPSLDEMTELNDGISVTGQRISRNSDKSLYYYVELQDELAELRVKTWGGPGDCELHIAYNALPRTDDWGWIEDDFMFASGSSEGRQIGGQQTSDSSYNSGNDEIVQLFDAQPGIYYVMLTSYSGCREVTIQADFTYSPDNVDPESAIELTAGIEYGPLSGFSGLDQYFYIDVPIGTERLEVDLNGGDGEAKLMMRLDQYPTWSTYDTHSNAPGAGDKIGFNDPTPGRWFILLGSEEYYSRIDITATFEDRYIWSYDGEPIQLFNEEELSGMSAPEGEDLYFYIELEDEMANDMTIRTWGGEGDLALFAETEEIDWEDFEGGGGGPMGRQWGQDGNYESDFGEADEEINIFFTSGRIDITITAITDIEDISILAKWESFDQPGPGPVDPVIPVDPDDEIIPCNEMAEIMFEEFDINGDGDLSIDELGEDLDEFEELDLNKDEVIDMNEAKLAMCNCENELYMTYSQIDSGEVSIEFMSSIAWLNEYDFFEIDRNSDRYIDFEEIEEYGEDCVTTYDPLDRDGDGTPDDKDAFPDDPNEDTDTDGDGVGDNADVFASVDNDVIWVSAGMLGLILVSVLGFMVVRSKREPEYAWEYQKDNMSEQMLVGLTQAPTSPPPTTQEVPAALDLGPPVADVPTDMKVSDLYD
jgi:hypothetical protein